MTSLRLLQARHLPRPHPLEPSARVRRVPSRQMQMRGTAAHAAARAAAAAHVAAAPHAPHAPHAALCGFGRPSCWCWRLIPARSVGYCGAARRLFTARARHAPLLHPSRSARRAGREFVCATPLFPLPAAQAHPPARARVHRHPTPRVWVWLRHTRSAQTTQSGAAGTFCAPRNVNDLMPPLLAGGAPSCGRALGRRVTLFRVTRVCDEASADSKNGRSSIDKCK